jgi:hypothetical protein
MSPQTRFLYERISIQTNRLANENEELCPFSHNPLKQYRLWFKRFWTTFPSIKCVLHALIMIK